MVWVSCVVLVWVGLVLDFRGLTRILCCGGLGLWHSCCVGFGLGWCLGFDCRVLRVVVAWFVMEFVVRCVECLVCFWLSGASFQGCVAEGCSFCCWCCGYVVCVWYSGVDCCVMGCWFI